MATHIQQPNISLLTEATNLTQNKWTFPSMKSFAAKKQVIDYVFGVMFPYNNDVNEIIVKTSLLNQFYNTVIFALPKLSQRILDANIDSDLKAGKEDVVEKIANLLTRKNYSFASKYCAMHNPKAYPISDRIVRGYFAKLIAKGNLKGFSGNKTFLAAKMRTDYKYYKQIYDAFMKQYYLTSLDYQQVDAYIWISCKENLTTLKLFTLI